MKENDRKRAGFSLIELVIVVVIIAIIAAIAVPKMSRGASGAADAATMQNLAQMRSAIEMFATEHGGVYPNNTSTTIFTNQLTTFSDATGANTSSNRVGNCIYGPYLKALPALPVGTNKGQATVTFSGPAGSNAGAGWYYDGTTIWANNPSSDADVSGKPYNAY